MERLLAGALDQPAGAVFVLVAEASGQSNHPGLVEITYPDVAELDTITVAEKANVPARALQPRVIAAVHRFRATGFVNVRVDNSDPVEDHGDLAAASDDLLVIPLANRTLVPTQGGNDSVDGPVVLVRLQVSVDRSAVIEDL